MSERSARRRAEHRAKARARNEGAVEECVRRWRWAREWHHGHTVQRLAKRARLEAEGSRRMHDIWVKSVQRARADGLLGKAVAHGIINAVVIGYLEGLDKDADPIFADIGRRMDDFLGVNLPPGERRVRDTTDPAWGALCEEWDDRDTQQLAHVLRVMGEREMVVMLLGDPDAYMRLVEDADFEMKEDEARAEAAGAVQRADDRVQQKREELWHRDDQNAEDDEGEDEEEATPA